MQKGVAAGGGAILHGLGRPASAAEIGPGEFPDQPRLGAHKNVLLIVSDDNGFDQLGCNGNTVIKTPHLDGMAARGVRFTNAFAIAPSCSASRGSLLTGLYTHQNGQFGHEHNWHHFSLLDSVETIPSLLKNNGYRTDLSASCMWHRSRISCSITGSRKRNHGQPGCPQDCHVRR